VEDGCVLGCGVVRYPMDRFGVANCAAPAGSIDAPSLMLLRRSAEVVHPFSPEVVQTRINDGRADRVAGHLIP
jgi:hypothetical protein